MSDNTPHFNQPFLSTLDSAVLANSEDDPNYYASSPRSLLSTSTVHSLATGTGSALYRSLAPLLESTNHELILVTCFWAHSTTLHVLNAVLRTLSDKAVHRGTEKIRVRLCFSSLSLFQKLFHKQSVAGQEYPPSVWSSKLGLPPPSDLNGLDLQIKSVFILPFSVMHPKFMIIDRSTVILPSCNISWEEWFEGCVTVSGPIANQFLQFYSKFWARRDPNPHVSIGSGNDHWQNKTIGTTDLGHGHILHQFLLNGKTSPISNIPTVFLPSPHRRNPQFRPFSSAERVIAPPTPLNTFILTLFAKAESSIRAQTPNLTSPPVLSALMKALTRGIDVSILTSEKLMVLEQLVTAGITTSRCVKKLIKRYRKLQAPPTDGRASDEEVAISRLRPGALRISYFTPRGGPKARGDEGGEPQQSHLKMTIVDGEVLVLGSGNLDRASWFTSQELGVAFFDKRLVEAMEGAVDTAMEGRARVVYDSRAGDV
ncbi:hypothetical protein BDV95DRAFT_537360 [Massariosphaeria phaeospora]|uniref:PLD phosphodiesterase domain-containing protein n=1 Tax=Massariosphaeria phaeospora TaxID=100035 RepID=A0A7C8IBX4_9PLEO|nr:hypothetical protein BDV95DRAFT_537360 [Massariosphaeria phaeospora]